MFKTIIFIIVTIIIEIPFFIKFLKAKNEFDITRQVAILILMLINFLIMYGLYKLILMIK